jgi:hypothetical protein
LTTHLSAVVAGGAAAAGPAKALIGFFRRPKPPPRCAPVALSRAVNSRPLLRNHANVGGIPAGAHNLIARELQMLRLD